MGHWGNWVSYQNYYVRSCNILMRFFLRYQFVMNYKNYRKWLASRVQIEFLAYIFHYVFFLSRLENGEFHWKKSKKYGEINFTEITHCDSLIRVHSLLIVIDNAIGIPLCTVTFNTSSLTSFKPLYDFNVYSNFVTFTYCIQLFVQLGGGWFYIIIETVTEQWVRDEETL